jgi:hypothetical protein
VCVDFSLIHLFFFFLPPTVGRRWLFFSFIPPALPSVKKK